MHDEALTWEDFNGVNAVWSRYFRTSVESKPDQITCVSPALVRLGEDFVRPPYIE
jgi:hypothetical protein